MAACGSGPLSRFRENFLGDVLAAAKKSEYLKSTYFEPAYRAIEKYVAEHNLIVSSEPGANVRQFKIYGSRIFFHANDLSNEVAELIPYVRMNTVVREKEFEIHIDGVKLVRMYNIDPTFAKIISPCDGGDHELPAEVELVDVYHRLYLADQFKTWPQVAEYEADLWRTFIERRTSVADCSKIESPGKSDEDTQYVRKRGRRKSKSRRGPHGGDPIDGGLEAAHVNLVTDWLKSQKEYAVVGGFASGDHAGAVQVIVGNVDASIKSLRAALEKFIAGVSIEVRTYDLQLPMDYRIKKYVIIARVKNDVYYIANLFNSASFELVPVTRRADGISVATPVVLLRFFFIELWFARVVYGFGKMSGGDYTRAVKNIFENIDSTHVAYLTSRDSDPIKSPPEFIGSYVNEAISKKADVMVPPYFPAQYKMTSGSYRDPRKRPPGDQ